MRDRTEFTLDVISAVDESIVDRNLQKRARLWSRRGGARVRRFVPWIAAAACLALLVGALLWLLPGIGKQVPVYLGMTVSDSPERGSLSIDAPIEATPLSVVSNLTPISYVPSAPLDGDRVIPLASDGSLVDAFGATYYAQKNEDVYIHIHISNPDRFEILSFTLNGVKYSTYMFEAGSDMETLILKYNVGDANGLQEYTIDAIKYVDGEAIKDVRMQGDQTVRVYVNDDHAPLQLNPTVSVDSVILNPTWSSSESEKQILSMELYEGDTLIRELSPTDRRITSLPMGRRLVLVATYSIGAEIKTLKYVFDTPALSQGLEVENGVVVGIGDCTDTVLYINQPIGVRAFAENTRIKAVYLGAGVTSIEEYAFSQCTSLKTVVLPDAIRSIGDEAFAFCENLSTINLPYGLESIGSYAFYCCYALKNIELPETLTQLGERIFEVTGLTEIVIPRSITSIPRGMFNDCTSLRSVTLHDALTEIDTAAFSGCGIESIVLPDSLVRLGDGAFYGNRALTEIVIPGSVSKISDGVFLCCESLTTVTILNGPTAIEANAFSGCSALTQITIPSSVTSVGECAFQYCSSLTVIAIPDSVVSIGAQAFEDCDSLTTLTIPEGTESLVDVFNGCSSLVELKVPASVTSMQGEFLGRELVITGNNLQWKREFMAPNLTDIYYDGTIHDWETNHRTYFRADTPSGVILHCSDGLKTLD